MMYYSASVSIKTNQNCSDISTKIGWLFFLAFLMIWTNQAVQRER